MTNGTKTQKGCGGEGEARGGGGGGGGGEGSESFLTSSFYKQDLKKYFSLSNQYPEIEMEREGAERERERE